MSIRAVNQREFVTRNRPGDSVRASIRLGIGALTVAAVFIAAASSAAGSSTISADATSDGSLVHDAVTLTDLADFASIDPDQLVASAPAATVSLTPTLVVQLTSSTDALTDGMVTINRTADAVEVTRPGGLAIITDDHADLEFRYQTIQPEGGSLVTASDGGLDQVTASGAVVGHIAPAFAVDDTGQYLPASYTYEAGSGQLVVHADTTGARGAVLIDPSWNCVSKIASLVGWSLAWRLATAVAVTIASGGTAAAVAAFLVWQGIAAWRTWEVINACR